MKKIILLLALFCAQQSTAQYYRYRRSTRWVLNNNQVQVNANAGYNFFRPENEYLFPVQFGAGIQLEYQFSPSHLIGLDMGFSSSVLDKNRISAKLDESSKNYRNLMAMTDGYNGSVRIGASYAKIFMMKRAFVKFSLSAGLYGNNKKTYSIELYDNSHGGLTDYTELTTSGKSTVSAYSKLNCSFGVPVGSNAALIFGPQLFATSPTSMRTEYFQVKNGYLEYAEAVNTKSSILSLDFNLGVVIAIDNY